MMASRFLKSHDQERHGRLYNLSEKGFIALANGYERGVDFVLRNFARMHGGEIFVPKIPSVKVVDLARAMAPDLPHKLIGIRPGEKLHEVMCPADDSHLTLEFDDHYVIKPTIQFSGPVDFTVNRLGEVGRPVAAGFEFHSGRNPHFLSIAPELAPERAKIDALRRSMPKFPTTLVMQERLPQHRRTTNIHKRGEFLNLGEPVEPVLDGAARFGTNGSPPADNLDSGHAL